VKITVHEISNCAILIVLSLHYISMVQIFSSAGNNQELSIGLLIG